jgi:hypothetical protein
VDGWKQFDKHWADGHDDAVRNLLADLQRDLFFDTFRRASQRDDTRYATDYRAESASGSIGCRLRRPGAGSFDVTIRNWRRSGVPSEFDKIRLGNPRWYLYAWTDGRGGFAEWVYLDMDVARRESVLCPCQRQERRNADGTTGFFAWPVAKFIAAGAVAAASRGIWARRDWTGEELEKATLEEFHAAVDALDADTVPKSYADKVTMSLSAEPCPWHKAAPR